MNKFDYIEFMWCDTPGPYNIPLKVSNQTESEILFDIEIDGITHSFPLQRSAIENSIARSCIYETDGTTGIVLFVSVSKNEMAKLYSKISAVMKSEDNRFFL